MEKSPSKIKPSTAITPPSQDKALDYTALVQSIKQWGLALGFNQVGITNTDLSVYETRFLNWLACDYHGEMDYMQRHGEKRSQPEALIPGTLRIISARMDYLPPEGSNPEDILLDPSRGYISRYALGRDYHKLIRQRLQKLANQIEQAAGPFGYRAFTDSAPVLEKPLAEKAGLGWIGKHTNLINSKAGSWFFLGELYTDLPLPTDQVSPQSHCGHCTACIDICPTKAIIAPYQLDARLCISYLTIELHGPIPVALRPLIGNRIYGCDDCQLVCPWNRFAQKTQEIDFSSKNGLDAPALIDLFSWTEAEFLKRLEGSAIRRIGYQRWLRNIAVAMGNAPYHPDICLALQKKHDTSSALVREHIQWALAQQTTQAI